MVENKSIVITLILLHLQLEIKAFQKENTAVLKTLHTVTT